MLHLPNGLVQTSIQNDGRRNDRIMIDKLEMLLALARERHFGRAAEACHVTQPTLSSAIKSLEELFGVALVNRGARFMGLTPEGELVLKHARIIVAEARALRSDIGAAGKTLTGTLTLGVIPTALAETAGLTHAFLADNPGVQLRVSSMSSHEIVAALADTVIDIGISYATTDMARDRLAGFEIVPLYDEDYVLVLAEDDAPTEPVDWSGLGAFRLALLTPDMQNRRIIDRNLSLAGVDVVPVVESNSIVVLVSHVRDGGIATILPARIAEFFGQLPGLKIVPIGCRSAPPPRSNVAFIVPPVGRRTLLVSAFMQALSRR